MAPSKQMHNTRASKESSDKNTKQDEVTSQHGIKESDRTNTDFLLFKQEIKDMIENMQLSQASELKKIVPALQQLKETNSNIEQTMSFLAAQNEELKKKLEQLEIASRQDKEYIVLLEEKLENSQRESRKRNVEIKNVPKEGKESKDDLLKMVTHLSDAVNCNITQTNVMDIYRLRGKKQENNSSIIVEMSSTMIRDNFLKKCKDHNIKNRNNKLSAKHLGHKNENTPIYVTEHLTARAARLRFLASDLTKSKGFSFCWTNLGRVFVRKNEASPIILIHNEAQVNRLMQVE